MKYACALLRIIISNMSKFISPYSANYFHLNAKPRKLRTGPEKCKWRERERKVNIQMQFDCVYVALAKLCLHLSRSGVIVWLKYFMCIGFALPAQTNRLICILSMKTKAESIETAGQWGEHGGDKILAKCFN